MRKASQKVFIDLSRLNLLLNTNIDPDFLKSLPIEQRNINTAFRHLLPGHLELLKQKSVLADVGAKLTTAEKNIHTGFKHQHITKEFKELTPRMIAQKRAAVIIGPEKARAILQKNIDKDFFKSLSETEKRMHRKFVQLSEQNASGIARIMNSKPFEQPEGDQIPIAEKNIHLSLKKDKPLLNDSMVEKLPEAQGKKMTLVEKNKWRLSVGLPALEQKNSPNGTEPAIGKKLSIKERNEQLRARGKKLLQEEPPKVQKKSTFALSARAAVRQYKEARNLTKRRQILSAAIEGRRNPLSIFESIAKPPVPSSATPTAKGSGIDKPIGDTMTPQQKDAHKAKYVKGGIPREIFRKMTPRQRAAHKAKQGVKGAAVPVARTSFKLTPKQRAALLAKQLRLLRAMRRKPSKKRISKKPRVYFTTALFEELGAALITPAKALQKSAAIKLKAGSAIKKLDKKRRINNFLKLQKRYNSILSRKKTQPFVYFGVARALETLDLSSFTAMQYWCFSVSKSQLIPDHLEGGVNNSLGKSFRSRSSRKRELNRAILRKKEKRLEEEREYLKAQYTEDMKSLRQKLKEAREKRLASIKPSSMLELNKHFFKYIEGIYSSYWMGRFLNMFVKKGKKKTAAKHLYKALLYAKLQLGSMPMLLLLELLERLKPTFRLRKYVVRRTQLKEYPHVARASRRYMMSVRWLADEIVSEYNPAFSQEPFFLRLSNKFVNFYSNPKKHSLTKTRNKHEKTTVKTQFNMRFNWRKKRRRR